jgi:outer membrane protein TolC
MWIVACATAIVSVTASRVWAQQPTEARIQELIRQAAEQVASGQAITPPPGGRQIAAGATRPTVALTLDEAVKLALDRNLDIAVQRLNPQTFDTTAASLRAVYSPTVTSTLGTQSAVNPSTSTVAGNAAGTGIEAGLRTFNGGLSQNSPWGGGAFTATLNNSRTTTTSLTALYNPSYNPNWTFQFSQPFLRGRATDSTRQQIIVNKLNQDISVLQLQATITNTLSNVRNAYWDYVFSVQAVQVAQQSVTLAERLVRDNETRVEIGTMAPIDVVQAKSQAATARQNLVGAQSTMRTAELALKRLIVSGTEDPNWNATLDPVDRPDPRPEPVDIDAAIRRALSVRTDLSIARKNTEVNTTTMKFLRNQTLPAADLAFRYNLIGLGGTQYITTGSGITRTVIGETPGGYSDALASVFGRNFPTWNVTLSFNYPLGTSGAQAAVARANIQLSQNQAQLRQLELQVATEVTNAATNVRNNTERVQAAQAARDLAQQQLDAENSKFEVGMSTNYLVVQVQRDLATSQNNELQAVLNYRKSLVELERLQQTTLQNLNITILSTGGLNTTAVGSGRPTVVAGGSGGG